MFFHGDSKINNSNGHIFLYLIHDIQQLKQKWGWSNLEVITVYIYSVHFLKKGEWYYYFAIQIRASDRNQDNDFNGVTNSTQVSWNFYFETMHARVNNKMETVAKSGLTLMYK